MQQAVDILLKFLKEHPEERHATTPEIFTKAMTAAFPCPVDAPSRR